MSTPRAGTLARTVFGTWLAAGALALGYGLIASGCAPATLPIEPVAPAGEIDSVEKAEQAWRAREFEEHEPIWREESGPEGDPLAAGLAAYRLASASFDPKWSSAAVEAFDKALEGNPGLVLARAWRGSAHALMARDYPVQGLLQILPGPGFVRLYHVKAAFSDLDAAVESAPRDPVIRLIRGSTYLGMPPIFGGTGEGLADFDTLEAWTSEPDRNADHAEFLRAREWLESYYLARARAMEGFGRNEDAADSWMRLAEVTDEPVLLELAKWHRISLDASQ